MNDTQEHPGVPGQNTRVFCVNTPGCFKVKDPGVFDMNKCCCEF